MMHYRNLSALAAIVVGAGLLTGARIGLAQDAKKDVKADPEAVALLREAHDKRESFPPGFSGLTANLTVNDGKSEVKGTLDYTSAGEVKIKLENATKEQETWASDELGSAFGHRRQDDFDHGDGSHPITFDPDDQSLLGRQVALNDKGNSHYRVKNGHITQVNRSMGPTMRFSITMMADRNLPYGKYLPSQFTVTVFDNSGAIKQVDMYTDGFKKVGDVWVPSARRIITSANGAFTAKSFALDEIKLSGITTASK